MNKPPDEMKGNWSAELEGAETWRDMGKHDSWWEAGMALTNEELSDWISAAKQHRIDWADLDESSRRGWRHLAIVLWCQPYTRKGAR